MKEQSKTDKKARLKAFEPVMDEVFKKCSTRINSRIDLILCVDVETNKGDKRTEKLTRASLKSKIMDNREGRLANGLDEDVVGNILNGTHKHGRNLYLFTTKNAKDYYNLDYS